jgi:pyruvate/2-oxoglutarate dehydrogenase complex dihydrolipoamide dehydrogenase (E3) component
MLTASISPFDKANRETIAHGHPADWNPPQPKDVYDFVIIGGGPAGLPAAFMATMSGHSVAVIERNLTGGTCVNFGCTPSKALLRAARAVFQASDGQKFGYALDGHLQIDFAAVMTRVREMRAASSVPPAVASLTKAGIDVFLGDGRFVSPNEVDVNGRRIAFTKALIATGSGPVILDVPGLADADYLTNETVFELTALPRRLVCLGGGAVNCELAQAFHRLGSEVELVSHAKHLLPNETPEASQALAARLAAEGVRLHLGVAGTAIDGQRKRLSLSNGSQLEYDALLVAVGRKVNVAGLGLDAAGIRFSHTGVEANDNLQTANPAVYAAGDVVQTEKYTHAAGAGAQIVVANALGGATLRVSDLVIPRCTYTDPEIAHVGLTPLEAAERGLRVDTYRLELAQVERPRIDGETDGFATLYTSAGRIVGATFVAAHAGESLPVLTMAVMHKMTPAQLAAVIFGYPTQAETIQRAALLAVQSAAKAALAA